MKKIYKNIYLLLILAIFIFNAFGCTSSSFNMPNNESKETEEKSNIDKK